MPTTKLCGANEAQRSLRPNERLVSAKFIYSFRHYNTLMALLTDLSFSNLWIYEMPPIDHNPAEDLPKTQD